MTGIMDQARDYFVGLQSGIVQALESLDGQAFALDQWERPEGGGGISRVIEEVHYLSAAAAISHTSWAIDCRPRQVRTGQN